MNTTKTLWVISVTSVLLNIALCILSYKQQDKLDKAAAQTAALQRIVALQNVTINMQRTTINMHRYTDGIQNR